MASVRSALMAAAWALTACGDGDVDGSTARADSAGVEVVANRAPPEALPERRLDDAPVLEIEGDEEGGVLLFQVRDVTPLADGRVAVVANGSHAVYLFAPDGSLLSTLGREGDGPGEFRGVESVVPIAGDSLAVFDGRHRRLAVFASDGGFGRSVEVAGLLPPGGWGQLRSLPPGLALVGHGSLSRRAAPGIYRDSAATWLIDGEGGVLARFGPFPGTETFVSEGMMGLTPFGARLSAATSEGTLLVGTGEAPELRSYDASGALTRVLRWPDADRTVTPGQRDAFLQASLDLLPPDQATALRPRLEAVPHPPRAPAFQDLLPAPDGSLWVGDYPGPVAALPGAPRPARRWLVFGPDGILRERVVTPEGFEPRALAGDRVYGVHVDPLGVERVRAYRTGRGGAP